MKLLHLIVLGILVTAGISIGGFVLLMLLAKAIWNS